MSDDRRLEAIRQVTHLRAQEISPLQSVITWIPVSERLPEEFTTVLIAFSGTSGWLRVWFGHHVEGDWFLEDGPEPDRIENVRFWTTVAPPKE